MCYENFFWVKTSVALFLSFENWTKHCKGSHYSVCYWLANHVGMQLQVSNCKKFKMDTGNWTPTITMWFTYFLIMTGSPCAYLSCNWCTIMWVSNYWWPIWTFVIGYPCDLHVNYVYLNGFLMFSSVFKTWEKSYRHFSSKEVVIR